MNGFDYQHLTRCLMFKVGNILRVIAFNVIKTFAL
jgi:hypothetical protein